MSESTLVKMPHSWKSHVTAQIEPAEIFIIKSIVRFHKKTKNTPDATVGKQLENLLEGASMTNLCLNQKIPFEPRHEISNNLTF